jgi:tetratricopeptide (TPR) repeat protein
VKRQPHELEQAEELVRRVLPDFDVQASPDFRARVLARAEALSDSQRRGFGWGMPTWVQLWTPALTIGVLLVFALPFWVKELLPPEQAPPPSETGASGTRGSVSREESDKTLYALIQEGERAREAGKEAQATEAYRQAVNQVAIPLNQLAWLAYERGKGTNNTDELTKGLAWARLAVQLQPEEAEYLDTLAVILCTVGEREEAIRTMEKAVQMEKDNQLREERRDKLARFRQGACQ